MFFLSLITKSCIFAVSFKEKCMGLEFGKWLLDVAKYMLTALFIG